MSMTDRKPKAGRPKGTPKTGGRKKGTPNKATAAVRSWLVDLIHSNRQRIMQDLDELEPKDRLMILERFMQYVVPKQQAVKAEISNLSDDELSEVATRILNDIAEQEGNDDY